MPRRGPILRYGAVPLLLALALIVHSACSEPPNREINQAQGAIDAARAAGAAEFAPEPLQAAITALERAQQAVADRDYRLALNHAIDARDRAREAARGAADRKAQLRSEAEAAVRAGSLDLQAARARLKVVEAGRPTPSSIAKVPSHLRAAERLMQEANAALAAQAYAKAKTLADDARERCRAAMTELAAAIPARPARRPGRRAGT
jgi:Domain of unknown function (DUF4398)